MSALPKGIILITPDELQHLIQGAVTTAVKQVVEQYEKPDQIGGIELAMEVTGYSEDHIRRMISAGDDIPYRKPRGHVKFSRRDLEEWIYPRKATLTGNDALPARIR